MSSQFLCFVAGELAHRYTASLPCTTLLILRSDFLRLVGTAPCGKTLQTRVRKPYNKPTNPSVAGWPYVV